MSAVKKDYILNGLGCANCALKMENGIRALDGVKDASIDFVSKKLRVEIKDNHHIEEVFGDIQKIVKRIEGHVNIVEEHDHDHKHCHGHGHNHDEEDCHEHSHEHGHSHGHGHGHGELVDRKGLFILGLGASVFAVAAIFQFSFNVEVALYLIAYALVGGEVLLNSLKNIIRGQVFDENFLMSIATIGAFSIGEFPEGVAVMLFYQIGEIFQGIAVNRSRKSIKELMNIRPDYANLLIDNEEKQISPDEVKVGDIIIVKPGEKIPLDGRIKSGSAALDTSALTGESLPREVGIGDDILSGTINRNGVLTVEVTKEFGESTVSKILELVENASIKKAPTEKFITKFARYYTPAVVLISLTLAIAPPLLIHGARFSDWLYRALVFLVVSCPCALVVSIPLGYFGGIGGASKNGILIKGSSYLEALKNIDTVVFDKTGTLTKGIFKVTDISSENGFDKKELLKYAALAESYSNHPIALSIVKAYENEECEAEIENYEEISGHGIKAKIDGRNIIAGNLKLMDKENIQYKRTDKTGTVIYVAIDNKYAGHIVISDEVKADSENAIKQLKKIGVKKTVMLTGDSKAVGENVGKQLGIDEVYTELLPAHKVEILEKLESEKKTSGKIVFVGDGINDAPVLARADIGFAMGGLGSDAAIEAADVVIMTDEPSKISGAIKIAKRTNIIVWQNIAFALGVKVLVLALGAGGIATMWEAVFADVGVALIAVINAMRVMKVDKL